MTIEEIALICELPNYTSFLDASFYLPYSPSIITKYVIDKVVCFAQCYHVEN